MTDYTRYYQATIAKGSFGFKLALGGTGLGKTRGIRSVIAEAKQAGLPHKFIYCANRIQLLNEMYYDLCKKDHFTEHEVIHLERNRDTVLNALTGTQGDLFLDLLHQPIIQRYARSIGLDPVAIERLCVNIQQITHLIGDTSEGYSLLQLVSGNLEAMSREVLKYFKSILLAASDTDRQALLENPVIHTLFPYVAFENDPNARVLLLTIHKAYLGFFNGFGTVNLTQLRDNIIFLDEFDFLESDLTQLICEAPQIEDPFLFVELFYRGMKRHKLPLDVYPVEGHQEETLMGLRDRLIEIVQDIDELHAVENIPFPDINQFTTHIKRKQAAIFQTNRTILRTPLYLEPTARSFEISLEPGRGKISALNLFNRVSYATARILYLFKEIETVAPLIFDEMLAHCFPQSYLADQVRRTTQLPGNYREQVTRFDNLLNSGFGLYEIEDLQQVTDKEEVKFRHYAIHTTPEKLLLSLAQKNLVFGLSATADIPRFLKHFNLQWLRKQLDDTDSATYFEVTADDETLIETLNTEKLAGRQNSVDVAHVPELNTFPRGKDYSNYVQQVADHFAERFGKDDPNGYRRLRVERFFATVLSLPNQTPSDQSIAATHILFYTTFAQIKFILTTPETHRQNLFQVSQIYEDSQFHAYRLTTNGNACIVIFYDATQAKYIAQTPETKNRYLSLFWQGIPVLLLTQYTSAGNGVNLQYLPTEFATDKDEIDFQHIHLMEAPYYFFDEISPQTQTSQEITTSIKKNLWYHAKLFEAKVISSERFFGVLENLRNDRANSEYRSGKNKELQTDSLKNRIATYIQALGRIERVWISMPTQTIFLADEVFDDFARFVGDDVFVHLHQQRIRRLSANLAQMMGQIELQVKARNKAARRAMDERLTAQDISCKDRVAELLMRLHAFRQGIGNEDAKHNWLVLRQAALEHDFTNVILGSFNAIFKTPYIEEGILYIDSDRRLYPRTTRSHDSFPWRLNAVYDVVLANKHLSSAFRARGYELAFDGISEQFFVPYFYQSVLVGAIGESAVKLLLSREQIATTEHLPRPLFELADLQIADTPWYIDCKNYSERTLVQFQYGQDDPSYRPELSEQSFIDKAQRKFRLIQEYHRDIRDECRLFYVNLSSTQDRPLRYFDTEFNEVSTFPQARIVVVQGCLNIEQPNQYTKAFEYFLADIKQYIPSGA